MEFLVLTICAVISGAKDEDWEDNADCGKTQLDCLRRYISLINGVPFRDCLAYISSRFSPKAFKIIF